MKQILVNKSLTYSAKVGGGIITGVKELNLLDTGAIAFDKDSEFNSYLTSTNLYIIGSANDSPEPGLLMKFDLIGNLVWSRKLTGSAITRYSGVTVLNDNIYVTGLTQISGTNYGIIVKYDSNGNVVWQKSFGSTGNIYSIRAFANELYAIGFTASTRNVVNLIKLNTDGTVLWNNVLDCTTQASGIVPGLSDAKNAFAIENNRIKFVVTNTATPLKWFMFVLPIDGSIPGTGTYVNAGQTFTYATQSMSTSNTSLTSADRSVTITSPTYTATNIISRITGTVTVPASTYTFNKTYI